MGLSCWFMCRVQTIFTSWFFPSPGEVGFFLLFLVCSFLQPCLSLTFEDFFSPPFYHIIGTLGIQMYTNSKAFFSWVPVIGFRSSHLLGKHSLGLKARQISEKQTYWRGVTSRCWTSGFFFITLTRIKRLSILFFLQQNLYSVWWVWPGKVCSRPGMNIFTWSFVHIKYFLVGLRGWTKNQRKESNDRSWKHVKNTQPSLERVCFMESGRTLMQGKLSWGWHQLRLLAAVDA